MFQFNNESEAQTYSSLTSLIKKNNGQFKSIKQSNFVLKQAFHVLGDQAGDASSVKRFFGIDMDEGQVRLDVNAYVRWADYGSKSYRPVTWVFILDQHGVVAQYKLGYVGDTRSGTGPDPLKTKLIWKREGEVVPLVSPTPEEIKESESVHVGTVGARQVFEGVVKSVISFERQRFHYYDSGVGFITRIDVNGSDVVYFGNLGEKGEKISFKATVKEHGEYKGRKQTVIARPKIVDLVQETAEV